MEMPLVWAHRGASAQFPENTLKAFEEAVLAGADGIELDIQMSSDGEIVVIHDETLERTSDGTGWVKDHTLQELKRMDFSKTRPECGISRIPAMKEVLALLKDTDVTVNIELKTGIVDYDGIEEKIIAMVHSHGMEDRVVYSSFNHATIMNIKRIDPKARVAFLYADGPLGIVDYALCHGVTRLHPAVYNLRLEDLPKRARENGIELNVWTVDGEELLDLCQKAGVHAVITNMPREAVQYYGVQRYRGFVEQSLAPWLAKSIRQERIESADGTILQAYYALCSQEKGAILIAHGVCEFFGKYHEIAYRFHQHGYSVFFVEMRGHGKSERVDGLEEGKVYVDSFDEYVQDLDALVDFARKVSSSDRLMAFGHSMGSCVAALYMERNPDVFACGVFSSPMFQMNLGKVPQAAVGAMAVYLDLADNGVEYAPGQHGFTGEYAFAQSNCLDKARYDYQFDQRLADPDYQTWGVTWAWTRAAHVACQEAIKNAGQLACPVLVCEAGQDALVKNEGIENFDARSPYVSVARFEDSRHEIFNACDKTREAYYDAVLRYFDAFAR